MRPDVFARLLPLLRPYRRRLVVAGVATFARPALNTAKVWLLKVLIDQAIPHQDMSLVLAVCGAYLLITVAKGVAALGDDYLGGLIGAAMVSDLRTAVYDHLQGLSLHFYHTRRLGDLLTRLSGDIGAVEDLLVSGIADTAAQILTILLFIGMLFVLDSRLALPALAVVPILALLSYSYSRRARLAQQQLRLAASNLTSVAEEGLSAVALVKAFVRESFERERYGRAVDDSLQARRWALRQAALFTPLIELAATLGTVLVIWLGTQAILKGQLTIGSLVVFLGYLGSLYAPIRGLSRLGATLQRATVGAERVLELLDTEPAHVERRSPTLLAPGRGLVEFREVTFGYVPEVPVLRGFGLIIQPGETVALVGHSGAGKTTAVSLLLAYYDPQGGSVSIDGRDLREADPRSVRESIAAVLQEPMLFQASVRENLRYGRLDATDEEIEEAARAAQADEFIRQLPEGYDTPVGPRGGRLSGGQRQRLAIARALLKRSPIVILDEATSALDAVTEAEVMRGVRARLEGQSVLIVAHRLSTVRQADRIAVLRAGRIVELGTHDGLLARQGDYARFYASQAGELSANAGLGGRAATKSR